jgi:hypothetical protein
MRALTSGGKDRPLLRIALYVGTAVQKVVLESFVKLALLVICLIVGDKRNDDTRKHRTPNPTDSNTTTAALVLCRNLC